MVQMVDERAVRETVYRTCLALDAENFPAFLDLCSPSLRYRITAYSPEIRKEMIWLDKDFAGMKALLEMVPQHLKRVGTLKRHVSVYTMDFVSGSQLAELTSSFLVVHTDPEGQSKLFAAGMYYDRVEFGPDRPLLADRRVHLETRDLGIGSHIPL